MPLPELTAVISAKTEELLSDRIFAISSAENMNMGDISTAAIGISSVGLSMHLSRFMSTDISLASR